MSLRTLHSLHTVDVAPGQVGVTVRNGRKWVDSYGEEIALCECLNGKHNVVGTALVVQIWTGQFLSIPAILIEHEHELSSRMYSGLLDSMRRAYGENFSESSEVTVVSYVRKT